jgi:hypothetical protein
VAAGPADRPASSRSGDLRERRAVGLVELSDGGLLRAVVALVLLAWPAALAGAVLHVVAGQHPAPGAGWARWARRRHDGPPDATARCGRCGRVADVVLARAVAGDRRGPPACCGETMRLVRTRG